ncbi:hypothetical protein LI328DRAFT_132945 [Trichoderma asperelloides]|nr:hypothetical protein LI328DRAFT_132945 [Trichoderma asperelloides]
MIPVPPPPLVLMQSSMLLALVLALARFRPVNKSARAVPRRMGQHHRTETLMHTYMQRCSTPPWTSCMTWLHGQLLNYIKPFSTPARRACLSLPYHQARTGITMKGVACLRGIARSSSYAFVGCDLQLERVVMNPSTN